MQDCRRAAGCTIIVATVLTTALAWPVLWYPAERVLGAEVVGRHHDPFTVMQQFAGAPVAQGYLQPATDWIGRLLGLALPPAAAYNATVLFTFPLAAWFAFRLAWVVTGERTAAVFAGLAFPFAPFHLAHGAYHPHVAQVQWVAAFFLALWTAVRDGTPGRLAVVVLAGAVAVSANAYHALVLGAVTPFAIGAFWLTSHRHGRTPLAHAIRTTVTLLAASVFAVVALYLVSPTVFTPAVAVSRDELFVYAARWWALLVPPVGHVALGDWARQIWAAYPIGDGLLEQQIFVGWSVIVLCGVAVTAWWRDRVRYSYVPACLGLAVIALLCALSPERQVFGVTWPRPSAVLHLLLPMFRSYARFAVVVQCFLVIVAGAGLAVLWRRFRLVALLLAAATVFEYSPPVPAWRDVLPTTAHRWLVRHTPALPTFDCSPWALAESNLSWLAGRRIEPFSPAIPDCAESDIADKLHSLGFRFLLVRPAVLGRHHFPTAATPGFSRLHAAADGDVFAIDAAASTLYLADFEGVFPREYSEDRSWRWAGQVATLGVFNAGAATITRSLKLELGAFGQTRQVDVSLDGQTVTRLIVPGELHWHDLGPLTLTPGRHALRLESIEPAGAAAREHPADPRLLAFRFGRWRWQESRAVQ